MTNRALVRSLVRDPLRLVTDRGSGWSPASLFAAGEQGGWWDPTDFTTMFQDSAGTTPVTATGQPVGRILDKSGRGNHLIQATAASRPTLQQDGSGFFYLSFDGVDDSLASAAVIPFAASPQTVLTVFAGIMTASHAAAACFAELGGNVGTNAGTFGVFAPPTAAANAWRTDANGDGATGATGFDSTVPAAPTAGVLSVKYDIGQTARANVVFPRINGVIPTLTGSDGATTGAGTFTTQTLFVGRRGGTVIPYNGRMYQFAVRAGAITAAQIAMGERFTGSRMGIVL